MKLTTLGALRACATIVRSLRKYFYFIFFAIIFRYAILAAAEK